MPSHLRSRAALILALAGGVAVGAQTPAAQPPKATGLPASLPLRRDAEPSTGSQGLGAFQATAVVLMLALLVAWFLKRKGTAPRSGTAVSAQDWLKWFAPANDPKGVRVLHSTRLTPRATLHVLHWDAREWLVGCTEHSVTLLAQREAEPQPPQEGPQVQP